MWYAVAESLSLRVCRPTYLQKYKPSMVECIFYMMYICASVADDDRYNIKTRLFYDIIFC